MILMMGSLGVLVAGSLLCLLTSGRPAWIRVVGPAVTWVGAMLGLIPAGSALTGTPVAPLVLPWSMPFGSFVVALDALSAVFVAPILIISALAALYGSGYLRAYEGRKPLAASWCCFNLLVASMLLVVVARNGLLFLLGWEVMSLASFFLVLFENEQSDVRRAGWTYLVATHLGSAFLLALFVLLGRPSGTLDFDAFPLAAATPAMAGVAFLLGIIGFGTKAGFMPLHVWLPEAHPAAPAHVSAVMSGVMIKTGLYGLMRLLALLGPPPPWWGGMLIAIGAFSGVVGMLFTLAQHDLKRMLAYSSIENIGIITLGLGIGLLGVSYGNPLVAVLGFTGCLLHVINHSVFKSLLFFNAGTILRATGQREIEGLGGLLKRMPATGLVFLFGAVAACGLPPLNGFLSEWLIYLGALMGLSPGAKLPVSGVAGGLVAAGALALIGGLAMACFTKAFGAIFLGVPRTELGDHVRDPEPAMRLPMLALAAACLLLGLAGPVLFALLQPAVAQLAAPLEVGPDTGLTTIGRILGRIAVMGVGVLIIASLLAWMRSRTLLRRQVETEDTWGCGYVALTSRMQYSASSFTSPLTSLFGGLLRTRQHVTPPEGLFPSDAALSTETPDAYRERLYRPAFSAVARLSERFHRLQHGRLNLYILSIVLTLLALLAWKLS